MIEAICIGCGKLCSIDNYRKDNFRHCSRECKRKDQNLIKQCLICGKPFSVPAFRHISAKTCSRECNSEYLKISTRENYPDGAIVNCSVHGYLHADKCYFEKRGEKSTRIHCKECRKQRRIQWEKNNPDKQKALYKKRKDSEYYIAKKDTPEYKRSRKNCHLKARFGITIEDYDELVKSQNGKCVICLNPEKKTDKKTGEPCDLVVDHCHDREEKGLLYVRALLCNNCNNALGFCGESIPNLRRMIKYIEKHTPD